MNWRTANNRRRIRQQQATPAFVRRNLDRWRGLGWSEIAQAIHDERLGRKRKRVPVRSNLKVLSVNFR
jgi:hypothetical protein